MIYMWKIFKREITEIRDSQVPIAKVYKRVYPKWMTGKIKKLIKKRNKAWTRYESQPNYGRHGKYKKLRNKVTKEIRNRRKMFEESLARKIKEEPKAFYSYVRSKTKVKERVGPLVNNNGTITNDKKEMSELLNEFFSSVFTREDRRNIPQLVLREG